MFTDSYRSRFAGTVRPFSLLLWIMLSSLHLWGCDGLFRDLNEISYQGHLPEESDAESFEDISDIGPGPACGDPDGSQSGAHCGGPNCPPCDEEDRCEGPEGCSSKVCLDGQCQPPTCEDGVQNGDETHVDCGGPDCSPCEYGETCEHDSDCLIGRCSDDGTCIDCDEHLSCSGCQSCEDNQCIDSHQNCPGCGRCEDGLCSDHDNFCENPAYQYCTDFQCVGCVDSSHCDNDELCRNFQCIPTCDPTPQSSGFGGGQGSPNDPFRICDLTQLDNLRSEPSAHFRLYEDLDLTDFNFVPFGYNGPGEDPTEFTGSFNGDGYSLQNLHQFGGPTSLFFFLGDSASVSNLTLENPIFEASGHMGALTRINKGTIDNVHIINGKLTATGTTYTMGGLVGLNESGTIRRSSFTGELQPGPGRPAPLAPPYVGGLVGHQGKIPTTHHPAPSHIEGSFADARISFNADGKTRSIIGGLVGHLEDDCSIRDSYAIGEFEIENPILLEIKPAGLVGTIDSGKNWSIERTHALVDFRQSHCAELIGLNKSTSQPLHTYRRSDDDSQCEAHVGIGVESHNGHFGVQQDFTGFDFNRTWHFSTSLGRPVLQWELP